MSLLSTASAQAQTRILFVGNSFTHGYVAPVLNYNAAAVTDENYNEPPGSPRYESDGSGPWGGVPGIFKKFADEAGLAYEVHIEAINGVGITYHYTNALTVIGRSAGWDKVVLQELSTGPLPANKGGNQADFFTYSTRLEQAIHSANAAAKVYLYETWARADLTYPAGQPYSGQSITAMGTDLHNGYYQAFAQNGHFEAVAPVGDAWQLAIQTGVAMPNPYTPTAGQLDLWYSYFHASKWGSYLSACVLLYQITGVDPRTLGAGEAAAAALGIAPADAVALQQVAYNQVSGGTSPSTYALSVNTVGSGTVVKNPDQATYVSGTSVSLTATSAAGFTFTGWSGDATGTTNPLTVTMTANRSITATFTAVPPASFTLTTNTVGTGTVTKNPNQTSYPSGTSVSLTATPGTGYTFSGWSGDATGTTNPLTVTMTANKAITANFTAIGGTGLTFYRALNINGNAMVLDGQNWEAATGAANFTVTGTRFANQKVTLNPATDALRASMIRSSVYGPRIDATVRNVPAGTYAVYAYVWEDNSPEIFDVRVQGQVVLPSYNSGAAGRWSRLGPYTTTVTSNGTLVVGTVGGYANLSGIEVWRQNTTGAARTALAYDFSSTTGGGRLSGTVGIATPQAYPNPTRDGRFWVLLPDDFQGPVAYSLVSVLGAELANGQLAGAAQQLNFSHEITTAGLYYLLLKGPAQRAQIKLVRQ